MPQELSRRDQFILKEYEEASRLTYHIDQLRNSLTGFFLTFGGVAGAALAILVKGEASSGTLYFSEGVIAGLLALVATLGAIVIMILARLRSAQIEHFRIINNIRTYFLGSELELWNVVELSGATVPKPNRKSGTYFWTLLIIVLSCGFLSVAAYLALAEANVSEALCKWGIPLVTFLLSALLLERLYFGLAEPPPKRVWSIANPPNP